MHAFTALPVMVDLCLFGDEVAHAYEVRSEGLFLDSFCGTLRSGFRGRFELTSLGFEHAVVALQVSRDRIARQLGLVVRLQVLADACSL